MTFNASNGTLQQDETKNSPNHNYNNFALSFENGAKDQEKSSLGKWGEYLKKK